MMSGQWTVDIEAVELAAIQWIAGALAGPNIGADAARRKAQTLGEGYPTSVRFW